MITLLFEASRAIFLLGVGPDLASAVAHYSTLDAIQKNPNTLARVLFLEC